MPNRVRILTVSMLTGRSWDGGPGDRGALARMAERARIVLLALGGLTGPQIAERVGCTEPTAVSGVGGAPGTGWPGWRTRRGRAAPRRS